MGWEEFSALRRKRLLGSATWEAAPGTPQQGESAF